MNKCALYTSGHNIKYFDVTVPYMLEYCKVHNIDFILRQQQHLPNYSPSIPAAFERFNIYNLLDVYDRVVWVDADILIKKSAPNIFDIVPEDKFGVYYESDDVGRDHFISLLPQLYNYTGVNRYLNSGVFVASKMHKEMFNMERVKQFLNRPNVKPGMNVDQDYLNIIIHRDKIQTHSLGYKFNCLINSTNSKLLKLAYFYHFAGAWNKKIFMKKFLLHYPCD